MDRKIGLIGFGNMARALADGMLLTGAADPNQLYVCAKHEDKLRLNAAKRGITHVCATARQTAEQSDFVIVAVKPYLVEEVLTPIREVLRDRVVISVAAGVSFDRYEQILLPGTHHLTMMPNTPVAVGAGIILCEEKHSLTDQEFHEFRQLFSKLGMIESLPPSQFAVAGDLAGCGPAFTAMYLEALADGAVLYGLSREAAYRLASQMVLGTASLQLATGDHPGAMKDAVCSPGGLTIAGVAALENGGFRASVIDALSAIQKKKNE